MPTLLRQTFFLHMFLPKQKKKVKLFSYLRTSSKRPAFFFGTWDQAQFERFSYILSNGYRWNCNIVDYISGLLLYEKFLDT